MKNKLTVEWDQMDRALVGSEPALPPAELLTVLRGVVAALERDEIAAAVVRLQERRVQLASRVPGRAV